MIGKFVACLHLTLMYSSLGQAEPTLPSKLTAYWSCAVERAEDYAGSNEPAESIATAALTRCDKMVSAAAEDVIAKLNQDYRDSGKPEVAITAMAALMRSTKDKLRENARKIVVTRIVELRAKN